MFSSSKWDGLAKIGEFATDHGKIITPTLFPVVDPKQQTMPIQDMKSTFGFDQVITSAYLMNKRIDHKHWDNYARAHEYLNFDGPIMVTVNSIRKS